MAYTLEALITHQGVLTRHIADLPSANIVPLRQKLEMLLLADELHEELEAIYVASAEAAVAPLAGPDHPALLTQAVIRRAITISADAPVAYVSADFFGGAGVPVRAGLGAGDCRARPIPR